MDYDDNDFQSQSFQLAGEENTKFSPGLRSYSLPKFDLDDNLQVHLRFDSLVESEVLLGIQSQEENQWIEDFSGGSSGIEFGSSAAESCSISRRNNVWSEATSSESVEMLLKSVGQDEMIMGQTIIEESDVCDGLESITNEMEPNSNQDGFPPSKVGDAVDAGPTLPPDKCLESFSGVSKNATDQLPQVETTLQTDVGEKYEHGSSRGLDPSSISEKCSLAVTEGNLLIDGKCNVENQKEDIPLFVSSEGNKSQDNPNASESMQVDDPSSTSVQGFVVKAGELSTQNVPQLVTEDLQKDDAEEVGEDQVMREEAQMVDQTCEENAVETSDNNVGNPPSLALKADSTVQMTEVSSEGIVSENSAQISKWEAVVSSKDTGMGDQLIRNAQEASSLVVEGDNSFVQQSVEISHSTAGILSSPVLEMDPSERIIQGNSIFESSEKRGDLLEDDGHQLESGISVSNTETLTVEERTVFKGQGDKSSKDHVGNPSRLLVVPSSTNIIHESHATENIKDGHEVVGVHIEDLGAEVNISSSMRVESMQKCDRSIVGIGPSDVCISHPDVSVLEKDDARLPADSGNVESETDGSIIVEKSVASSSVGKSTTTTAVMVPEYLSDQIVGDESVSTGVVSEITNLASNNKSDGVDQLLLGSGVATGEVIERKEDVKLPIHVEDFAHLDKKKETVTRISMESSSLVVKESSQMANESVPVSGFEHDGVCDRAVEMPSDTLGQSSPSMETASMTCQNEHQAPTANKATQECSKELEGSHVVHDSVMKENDRTEVVRVSSEKYDGASINVTGTMPTHGETLTQAIASSLEDIGLKDPEGKASLASGNNNGVAGTEGDALNGCEGSFRPATISKGDDEFQALEAGSSSPNADEPNCGSPTVISCSELSQSEKEHQDGGRESLDKNAPVSDRNQEANKVRSTAREPKENDASEEDRSFSFEVSSLADLSARETGNGWKPFSSIQPYEFPQTLGVSPPTTSGLRQIDPKMLQEISRGSPRTSGGKNVRRSSKGNAEDKTRSVSGKAADRESAKEGKPLKEATPTKQTKERGINSFSASPSSLGIMSRVVQAEEMRPFGYIEGSSTKPCAVPAVQTSNLPDLNTLAPPSALFQQPFTDFQQVQLRAQIFVYGSLIQGTAPDEACMMSAFGESGQDGGRSAWENIWRVAVERFHNQKSPLSNPETPLHLHSGARIPELAMRQIVHQSEALSIPAGRAGSKGPPSAIINPVMPLSSPVWTISTPSRDGLQSSSMPRAPFPDSHQTLFPLHTYQSPHTRHYVGNTSPWLSQAPSPGTWVLTPQTAAVDASAHYSALPVSETVNVTSVRDSSVPRPSGMQYVPPSPFIHTGGPTSVPAGTPLPMEAKSTAVSSVKHASADSKPRKRKKSQASEEVGQIPSLAKPVTEPVSATGHLPTSVAITTPASSASKIAAGSFVSTSSPMPTTHYQIIGGRDTEQRIIFSEETYSRIEQAKLQAEDASALAASAVRHSQGIWSQLAIQKNSGLVSDVEAKLASAAVAIAAAASVAKAAAAAAKVASDAALQAKLMADEALVLSKSGNPAQSSAASLHDGVKNLGKVSPASILKGKDRTNSSNSILVAARETARKRVEAASAATKRAENLDALLKAAELAAEAVSQAGAIIAMGDPIPLTLSELVEAGPEGYWKVQQIASEQLVKSNNANRGEQSNVDDVEEALDRSAKHSKERPSNKKETKRTTDQGKVLPPKEMPKQSVENNMWVNGMHWDSITNNEKGLGRQKGRKTSDLANTIGVVPESQIESRNVSITIPNEKYEGHQSVGAVKENSIKEGSSVEVLSDEDGLRRVWFSGKVLSLKDGKAFVCYTELVQDGGSGQPNEWVPLGGEGGEAPRIRIAHPMTAIKYEGTRKRRRAARGDYVWSVGDKVDAWIRDGWWEGVITEKSKEDETNLTVHFPAQGNTSVVRAWDLRQSLTWKDGQWVECSCSTENNCYLHEGDTPQEKRPKLGRHGPEIDPAVEARGKDKMSNHMGVEESGKPQLSRPLALSAKEKIFNVGKNLREDKNSDSVRTRRTGLQKEGSRVIFGVPKPGKKRKFMEVSKHYVADRGGKKINEGNDSIKFAKYLIPQGSGSRGWKNTSKIDSKGKRVAESKPRVLKSGKAQSIPSRNLSEKDSSTTSVVSASNDSTMQDHLPNVKAYVSHDQNIVAKQNLLEIGSFPNSRKASEGAVLFSTLDLASDAPSSNKKSSSAIETDQLARKEDNDAGDNPGKSISDAVEPRRSNRRIQPTSRLLEGLQSSLIISKIPAVSHDKATKAQHRNASSRGNNNG